MLPGSRSRESCFPGTCPGNRAARVEGVSLQHLCAPSQHHDVAPASVTVKMQTHLGMTAYMGKAVCVRAVVDQSAVVLPQKPHRVRLRCPVNSYRREPDHLLVKQTLAYPLAEASRWIGKEMAGHGIKARSVAAGPPGVWRSTRVVPRTRVRGFSREGCVSCARPDGRSPWVTDTQHLGADATGWHQASSPPSAASQRWGIGA